MKYYVDKSNNIFAYPVDGSQDHLIGDKKAITIAERNVLIEQRKQANFDGEDWFRKRLYSYPELGEFVDAWVKNDQAALEEYRQKCLAVKAQFPKPAGF